MPINYRKKYFRCVLVVTGKTDVSYVAKETPMVQYLNAHTALEMTRTFAEENNTRGPVVMIVGPQDVGKSTLCKILLNYAVRNRRRPIFVDLDVGQGSISVPGSMGNHFNNYMPRYTVNFCFLAGALLVERPATVEEGFSQQAPLIYHFGHKSPGLNNSLYKILVSKLAEVTLERLQNNKKGNKIH